MITRYQINLSEKFLHDGNNNLNLPRFIHDFEERRKEGIEFHAQSGDYFGTLATIIGLVRDESNRKNERQDNILKRLTQDLNYLQKNYKIVKID